MTEPRIKAEPEILPSPDLNSINFGRIGSAAPAKRSPASRDFQGLGAPMSEPEWRQCNGEDKLKRVKVKEQAARDAVTFFQHHLLPTLKTHLPLNVSCQHRIEKIGTILSRKKEFQVLVGFLGVTGAGKTTLINALVGIKDLLPSSHERACTAVVVEVSYNKCDDQDSLYRSEIVFITATEWREELSQLFQDIQASVTGEDDDEEVDTERQDRIKQMFDKIKYVYPNINTLDKLKASSVEELLSHPRVRDILGGSKTVSMGSRSRFSTAIKEYIDSGESNQKNFACWPLVKLVKVYIKSPLLENGITLVDLPGNLDSNAARSAIAEKYQKELSVTCVVAAAARGISERNAQDLLEKVTRRNLQLDGLFNADSLCFVLSQCDREFDIPDYIKQHPNLKDSCSVDLRDAWTTKGRLDELRRNLRTADISRVKTEKLKRELNREIERLRRRLSEYSKPAGPVEQKRKLSVEDESVSDIARATSEQISLREQLVNLEKRLADTEDTFQKENIDISALGRRIASLRKALFYIRSRMRVACIKNRNELSTAAIRSDYENSLQEMGRSTTGPLQVFCVASTVYLNYPKFPGRVHAGYPTSQDTYIPIFRDWLIGTTLETRERYAQTFLEDVEGFVESTQPWANDTFGDTKMAAELRELWEPQLDDSVSKFEEDLTKLSINTTATIKHHVETSLYSQITRFVSEAAINSKTTCTRWQSIHWSTHRSINRNHGRWKDSKKRDHKWNDELVLDLTGPLVKVWDQIFFVQLPAEIKSYITKCQKLIADFADLAIDKDICLDVSDGIEVLKDQINRTANLLDSQTDAVHEDIKKSIQSAHRLAVPAVKEFLQPMYEKCGAEGSSGHYGRNKATHKAQMKHKGKAMHQQGALAVRAAIDKILDSLPANLATGFIPAVEQIKESIKLFFEQNSTIGIRLSTRKSVSLNKVNLRRDLLPIFNSLTQAWASKLCTAPQPADEPTDDEMDFNDDQFFEDDRAGDEDYDDRDD